MKPRLIFLLIFSLALLLRSYHLETLTTFGRDQGIDFLVVKDMVNLHKWTLIGIKTSIGDFFQGPIYLYILLPFFIIFKLNPIAGAWTAICVSLLGLILLYQFLKTHFNLKTALLGSLLYAVSPELVKYGNTPLYQYFLPPILILIYHFFLRFKKATNKKNLINSFLLGLLSGLGMEMHFLMVTMVLAVGIYFVLYFRKIKVWAIYILGLIIGLSPTLAFEIRHQFLNSQLFLRYLFSSSQTVTTTPLDLAKYWFSGTGNFLGANNLFLGAVIFLIVNVLIFTSKSKNKYFTDLRRFSIILFILLLFFSRKFIGAFHYALPFWLLLLFFFSDFLARLRKRPRMFLLVIIIFLNLFQVTSLLGQNHGYFMPAEWNLNNIVKTARIISIDSKNHSDFNVASLLDGDTRSYPLRYSVTWLGATPKAVEAYPQTLSLYLIARNNISEVTKANVWEVNSMKPFTIGQTWDVGPDLTLYRLDRHQ